MGGTLGPAAPGGVCNPTHDTMIVPEVGRRGSRLVVRHLLAWSDQGLRKFQRAVSLLGSNRMSAGVLAPTAERATGWLELSIALAMMR